MKKLLYVFLVLLVVFTIAVTIIAAVGNNECVVINTMMDQSRNDNLQEQLNDKFPDKNIIVTFMSTGKTAAKVYAENESTEIDILVGMGTGYLDKLSDRMADISGISRVPYLDQFSVESNNNKWITWEMQAGAIIVNKDVLKKYGLKAPKDYDDLLKPEYNGLITMPDPKSSVTGYSFYKSWVNSMGEEAALEYVDKLYVNMKQLTESGSGPIKLLKQGEVAIGLGLTYQAVSEINNGHPFEIIFPKIGSPYSLTGTAMLKGRETNPDIVAIYDFIVNDYFINDKENYSPGLIYNGQINKIPNYPQNITYANMTGIQDIAEKERLLSLWKY
ncbi:MAG TPA: extracellular solute-binding protein [Methanocorpusculum sp.]|nr:extracellular solute-binding protein [Methanocorpusculum sp.]